MFPERDVQLFHCKGGRTVKMVDDSACEVIDTWTVNITGRDEMMSALEAVRYVSEARYNLISMGYSTQRDVRSKCMESSQLTKET